MIDVGARSGLLVAAAVLSVAALTGCGGGDGDGTPSSPLGNRWSAVASTNEVAAAVETPAGPNLDGSWSGFFLNATTGARRSVTAQIAQDGTSVIIDTNLPGLGGFFTGSVQTDGFLWLTDASDGETWTTLSGPATSNYIVIQDYVTDPDDPNELLLNTIVLSR